MSINPTTRDFIHAKASKKPEMIMEGFDRMIHDLNAVSQNLKILTGWLDSMPAMLDAGYAQLPDVVEFRKKIERYVLATDELTAQIVMNAEKIRALGPIYKQQSA